MRSRKLLVTLSLALLISAGAAVASFVCVRHWEGTAPMTTEAFPIRTRSWLINYATAEKVQHGSLFFGVIVYRLTADGGEYVDSFNTLSAGPGRTWVHSGPGQYYLQIFAGNAVYSISAYEYRE